jgi:hypothetical protein
MTRNFNADGSDVLPCKFRRVLKYGGMFASRCMTLDKRLLDVGYRSIRACRHCRTPSLVRFSSEVVSRSAAANRNILAVVSSSQELTCRRPVGKRLVAAETRRTVVVARCASSRPHSSDRTVEGRYFVYDLDFQVILCC